MNTKKGLSRFFYDPYSFIVLAAILLGIAGMLQVTFSFVFLGDEQHLFADSLWVVDSSHIGYSQHIESLYNHYFTEHYPERGGHPNGAALILGIFVWTLNIFKDVTAANQIFFVLSIRLLLIATVLLSFLFLYLFFREADETNGKRIGKIAVIITAIFPPFIAYSSIRAMDTLSLLFMMISLWSFVRLIKSSRPSVMDWIIPGITAGIFLTLKISGPLIIMLIIVYGIILPERRNWQELSKKIVLTLIIAILVLVATNNPFSYLNVLLFPSSVEFHSLTNSDDIRRFGFIGFQLAKLWEHLHPDYYHYLGYHRHAGPPILQLGLINKYLTSSFFILYIVSLVFLVIIRKWKELLILNLPFVILFLSLPNYQFYRLLPAFPLCFATVALALIIIWDRYKLTLHRVIISFFISLIILIVPVRSFFDVSFVNDETYLDLGDIAARNRSLHLARGLFYDRDLVNYRTYKLGTPFYLRPLKDGVLKEKLIFREPGKYFVDVLLSSRYVSDMGMPHVEVIIANNKQIIRPFDKELSWSRVGPFIITSDKMEQTLSINVKGIKYENTYVDDMCTVALYDIRVVNYDYAMEGEKPPKPWWMARN